ncbi:hypothetical protein Lser_V15G36720 [Lactuca serriola]
MGLHLILFTFFSITFATIDTCVGAQNCSEDEVLALLKFKRSIKDDFKMLSSWVSTDCCSWKGVRCDDYTGSVVGLHLRGNITRSYSCNYGGNSYASTVEDNSLISENYYLVGEEVSSSLADLRHLKSLDLSGNDFHGIRIPEFIGSLKQLNYLNLSNTGFMGIIPHHIGNLSNLKSLDLNSLSDSQNLMVDDMAWISGLSSLDHLDLNGVDLNQAPNRHMVLYMIPSLIDLSLSCCGISNVDLVPYVNLSKILPNVINLDLSYNSIEGKFPSVLANMSSLSTLDLSGNSLSSSIPVIHGLLNLYLSYNNFEHIGIWKQCHLKILIVSNNNLGLEMIGPSTNISTCPNYSFEILDLFGNGLNDLSLESLGRLTNLRVLNLRSNRLKGQIHEALGRLKLLRVLDLSFNQLEGPIPTFLGQLTELDLSYNHLTGPIPESFGNLVDLTVLKLESNQLMGPIPESLERLDSLQVFSVSSNSLNGTIPVSIGQLTHLNFLDVSNNSLEGLVSESHFANLSRLKYLDMSSNTNLTFHVSGDWIPRFQLKTFALGSCKISDEFPQWIQTQRNLDKLVLSNASISGALPTWLQQMPIIRFLDLSHNNLSGSLRNLPNGFTDEYGGSLYVQNNLFKGLIPRSLCKRTSLEILDLSRNRLTGKIPNCLENLKNLNMMLFSSNRLSGVIPRSLGHVSPSLSWLNLNENSFTGEIPQDLGKLRALRVLDFGDNKFSGNIPKWIGENVTTLMVLRLHNNNFTGRIPQSLCRNSNLQILDVAYNGLTGSIPRCFGELNGMIEKREQDIRNGSSSSGETVIQVMRGVDLEYTKTLGLVFNMDLSSNKLMGEIPKELTSLSLLVGLNLSHNHLIGVIPDRIGNMKLLFSLDFSGNELSGMIPQTLAALNFLSHLNLSHNNLSGRIPTGNQLQTLTDPSIYVGNIDLCGAPLPKDCSYDYEDPRTITSNNKLEANDVFEKWFYLGAMCGLSVGFWGVIGVLVFKKQWRKKLYLFVEVTMDMVKVAVTIRVSKMKRGREAA